MTIWKFPISITDKQFIGMPDGARVIDAGLDLAGVPCLWALVNEGAESAQRVVVIKGTGHPIAQDDPPYFGSFTQGPWIWHVFLEN